MADDKTPDSEESVEFESYAPAGGATAAGPSDAEAHAGTGEDQPGENLASQLLEDDVPAYEIAPDETEAEELLPEGDPRAVQDDPMELVRAEAEARVAPSTRPMKRKQRRALAEAEAAAGGVVVDEPVLDDADTVVRSTPSLRPTRRSAEVEKKGHATAKQARHEETDRPRRVGPVQFVREAAEELRKVVWPTGAQLWQYFVVVLIFVLFIIAFVSLLDLAFGWALLKLLG